MYNLLVITMSVSQARAEMHHLLEAVQRGEEVTLTRHGDAVAVIVRPDMLRTRRADEAFAMAAHIDEMLTHSRARAGADSNHLTPQRADELVADLRVGRGSR